MPSFVFEALAARAVARLSVSHALYVAEHLYDTAPRADSQCRDMRSSARHQVIDDWVALIGTPVCPIACLVHTHTTLMMSPALLVVTARRWSLRQRATLFLSRASEKNAANVRVIEPSSCLTRLTKFQRQTRV